MYSERFRADLNKFIISLKITTSGREIESEGFYVGGFVLKKNQICNVHKSLVCASVFSVFYMFEVLPCIIKVQCV